MVWCFATCAVPGKRAQPPPPTCPPPPSHLGVQGARVRCLYALDRLAQIGLRAARGVWGGGEGGRSTTASGAWVMGAFHDQRQKMRTRWQWQWQWGTRSPREEGRLRLGRVSRVGPASNQAGKGDRGDGGNSSSSSGHWGRERLCAWPPLHPPPRPPQATAALPGPTRSPLPSAGR